MALLRGSATALNASVVVAARATTPDRIPIWEYVKAPGSTTIRRHRISVLISPAEASVIASVHGTPDGSVRDAILRQVLRT